MKRLFIPAGVLLLSAAPGCNSFSTNSDEAIARGWAPSRFFGSVPTDPVLPMDAPRIDPGPRTETVSREHWPLIPITTWPVYPERQPVFTRSPAFNDSSPRAGGKFPTSASAIDSVTTEQMNAQVFEGLAAPFYAVADMVLFIPRAIRTPPWATVDNSTTTYERTPGPRIHAAARAGLLPPPAAQPPRRSESAQ
ncbi:MAG: hypothetical protein KF699_04205 [Phycisphaeraceae bacterium]|nr:hypothetical protein [Phycisphaeraceae bacterium]